MTALGKPGQVRKPRALREGDKVRVVAPAGVWDGARMDEGRALLESWGLRVEGPAAATPLRYMSASDAERARELEQAFMDEDVAAVFCARGGFGSARAAALLGPAFFAGMPAKLFVGFSDLSILLSRIVTEAGLVCFHGPMVAADLPAAGAEAARALRALMFGTDGWWDGSVASAWRAGKAEGALIGGCLSVLVTTLGTDYELETTGRVLFLEDVAERRYRIDRMLTHLKHAGKLDHLAGLVLGTMTDCDDGQGEVALEEIVMDIVGEFSYPVLFGLEAGHCSANLALPFGCRVSLDGETHRMDLLEAPLAG